MNTINDLFLVEKERFEENNNLKLTENGAVAYKSTNDNLLDLFATIGSLRSRTEEDITDKFEKAFNESPLLAVKMLFYAGNIRGGLGERRTFRICLKWLANNHPSIVKENLAHIAHYTRYDNYFELIGTPVEYDMFKLLREQFYLDRVHPFGGKPISLLAKWLPSVDASSRKTRNLGRLIQKEIAPNMTERNYRKTLSKLRKKIDITERKMSSNEWGGIDYSKVPSGTMKKNSKAFSRNDGERFSQYLYDVATGEAKINSSTLYPYELVQPFLRNFRQSAVEEKRIQAQWDALPNYLGETEENILVMADVSCSMMGREAIPMATSISLAIYFAERNKGAFSNLYMTFTDKPQFLTIDRFQSLKEKVCDILARGVGYSTNLHLAFETLLKRSKENQIPQKEMPKAILVISDMEIDNYSRYDDSFDFVDQVRLDYALAGYEMPQLILWNVEARNNTFLSKSDKVQLVSGASPSTFKNLLQNLGKTSAELMESTLNDPIYDRIVV